MRLMPTNPPRGWLRDSLDPSHVRYWDGMQFTAEMRWDGRDWVPLVKHARLEPYTATVRSRPDNRTPLEIHVRAKRTAVWFAHLRSPAVRLVRPRPRLRVQ